MTTEAKPDTTLMKQNCKNHEDIVVVSNRYLSIQYLSTAGNNAEDLQPLDLKGGALVQTEKPGIHGDHLQ
ncbi:hypothetical protein [Methylobacter sp. BBA5.1]|jgi:hypothetical protein|uniref:hypothetical protein n=1 Tax=Methylobacter sp. BBA5.1 TaxID=1495064 RepID=UPI0003820896|nr:hypothetical protein [Methylobacter sp. BBA5.1]